MCAAQRRSPQKVGQSFEEAAMAAEDGGLSSPPRDTFNVAYLIYFLLGAGYLVPWNAFITAIDYFELLYPSGQIDRVFSIVYMIPAVVCIFLLTFFGRRVSAALRVNAGLVLFIAMLVVVPIMGALFITDARGTTSTYAVTVFAAAMNGVADALVQGSIVGSAGELPPCYMQALMAGTAASGVLVSILRLITRAVMPQTNSGIEASAYLYFIVSVVIMLACIACYNLVGKLPVMQYYNKVRNSTVETTYLLEHTHSDKEKEESKAQEYTGLVAVEDLHGTLNAKKPISYMHVWKKIQGFAFSIAFIYLVTLSIFPGHITEDLHSSFFGDWYAVLLTLCYNLFDLVGKFLPAFPRIFMTENTAVAIGGCVARALFYPLFYLCLHGPTFFQSDTVVIILTCLLGLTNGYSTTIVMILAPKSVPLEEAEVAGFLMVMFLLVGLALGSILEWVWVL